MTVCNIRFKFHEDNYEELCKDCYGFLFQAKIDSQIFALKKDYLYVKSNGTDKEIYGTTLMNQSVKLHPSFDGEVGYKGEYILDIKIPQDELEAIKNYGFDYEIL